MEFKVQLRTCIMDHVESKSFTKFENQVKDFTEFDLANRTCRILIPNLSTETRCSNTLINYEDTAIW